MDPGDTPLSLEVQYGTSVAPTVTRGMITDSGVSPTYSRGEIVDLMATH